MHDVNYLRAIIIDDEYKAIENLRTLIATYCPSIKITDSALGVESAAIIVNDAKPDVLFLDVSMPKKSGFELLNMLQYTPLVVFVTAYEKYALKAIKASAVDFLLKPVDINELKDVEKKLLNIQAARKNNFNESYNSVVGNVVSMLQHPGVIKNITLPDADGYNIIDINEILYLEGENNYTSFHLQNKNKIVVSKTLKEYEELLEESGFFRIHKSNIINLRHLKKVSVEDGVGAHMSDGRILGVSRRRTAELMEKARQYVY